MDAEETDRAASGSRLAEFIRTRQADIIADWARRTRRLSPARELPDVAIIDELPAILLRVADWIAAAHAGDTVPLGDLPSNHAVNRLGRGFDFDQIVAEYSLLRRSILDLWLTDVGPIVDGSDLRALDSAFDESLAQSATRYAQARDRLSKALDRVSEAALESADVDAFLGDLLQATLDGSEAVDTCVVMLREGHVLRVRAAAGLEAELATGFSISGRESFAGRVAAARRPIAIRNAAVDPSVGSPVVHAKGVRALYGVPMLRDGTVIGVAAIGSVTAFEFSEEDKLLFRAVVSRASSAVVKARILAELQRAETAQRFLSEASRQFGESLDYETTLAKIAHLAVPTIADWCVVDLAENGGIRVVSVAHAEARKEHLARELQARYPGDLNAMTGIAKVLETGVPEWSPAVDDAALAATVSDREQFRMLRELGLKSYIVVPIVSRKEVLGAIALVRAESNRGYTEADLDVAEDLARRAATAIDNARLYGEARSAVASRQQVLAVVSHDLRNQLGVIGAAAELLARKLDSADRDDLTRPIEAIRRTSASMQRLVGDLVDVAAIQAGQFSVELAPVPIVPLLEETRDSHEAIARSNQIQLLCRCDAGDLQVAADRARLLQALANLVGNAIKFTPPGGTVTLAAERRGCEAVVSVSDTGPGIPADQLPSLFEPYRTIERQGKSGTGLGLYIARGIVQRHGGRIWIESTVGAGTTFFFTLPLA